MTQVLIIGGGFAGLKAARRLGKSRLVDVTILDQRNHHLFQPLLYQVAMAGLDPSDIARPIRSILEPYPRVRTILGRADSVDLANRRVRTDFGSLTYDYLVLACGSRHSYFGHSEWEDFAPGLKTVEQATEIRRRVLVAFEQAERTDDPAEQRRWMTFVIVGGGPTGVELAGSIAEMARTALSNDFRTIDSSQARVIVVEGSDRVLKQFAPELCDYAKRSLESLGVEVLTGCHVVNIDRCGVDTPTERISAGTVLWAAGVQASKLGDTLGLQQDRAGRVMVGPDLTPPGHPNVFISGDMAHVLDKDGQPLPGLAPVAMQQGTYVANTIIGELKSKQSGKPYTREPFEYWDRGQMATIGRKRAVAQTGRFKLTGFVAWLAWLLVHIYYLNNFRNKLFVFLSWIVNYITFSKGAAVDHPERVAAEPGNDAASGR